MEENKEKIDNPPAFPTEVYYPANDQYRVIPGASLRDYFAAKSLNGIVSNEYSNNWSAEQMAEHSYKIADAMLKERMKYEK